MHLMNRWTTSLSFMLIFAASYLGAAPDITLTFPNCFPRCTADDQKRLLEEGDTEKIVLDAIARADREIRFSIYTFSRYPLFLALVHAAADRGIVIKGLVDRAQIENLRPYCDDEGCDLSSLAPGVDFARLAVRERIDLLKDLELYKAATMVGKLYLLSYRNEDKIHIKVGSGQARLMHNKFLIVDDKLAQTSSGNWSSTAMSVNFENTVQFNAPDDQQEIDSFLCAFDAIWGSRGAAVSGLLSRCALENRTFFTPSIDAQNDISATIMSHIQNTRNSIDISMHHLEHPLVYEYLYEAASRGVRIRLLFDDDDCPQKTPAPIRRLLALTGAEVTVRYLPTNCAINQLSHNRFAIFDEHAVINGSANWSKAGLKSNYESFVRFEDAKSTEAFVSYFDLLLSHAVSKESCTCDLREEACRRHFCRGEFSPR